MSDDLLTTIRFEVDASGIATGLTSVKRSIADLGNDVRTITEKTNAALSKVGTAELPVTKGLEKASKTIIKQTGEMEKAIATFGSTASISLKSAYKSIEAEEVRLRGMGIDPAVMNPYLEKLKEVQKLSAAVARQEQVLAQEVAKGVEEENRRLEHTLELKRQIANVKTTVESNAAKAQAEAIAQQQMKLLALNNQIQASNKATAAAQAQEAAKTAAALKEQTAAIAAFKTEIQNAELNLTHFGRAKTAAFLEDKGRRLGFDPAMVQAELAGLQKIEAANKAAFAAANPHIAELKKRAEAAGTSVKGLTANLRNVPAQLTDIVVSLQGGQAPLTVLLQQGGQLTDMFGGIGNAARALGGYVVSLINPFTLAAAAVGTLGYSYFQGSKELDEYRKALILTGNAVGLTSGQMADMARSMASVGGTQSKAAEALVAFVNVGAAGSDSLQKFAQSAINFEKVTGQAVEETAKQFAELGKNPLEASVKLNESTNFLTMSLYEQIKALEEQGKKTEAANVAQQAYSDTLNQNTAQITANLGTIEKGWNAIASATKGAWDWMKNIGRDTGPQQKLAQLQIDVLNAENNFNNAVASSFGGAASGKAQAYKKELQEAQDKLAEFNKTISLAQIRATDRGIEAQAVKDRIEWDKTHQSQLDKLQQSLHKEVDDYAKLKAAGKDDAQTRLQYEQRIHHLVKQEADYLKNEYKVELKQPKAKKDPIGSLGNELSVTKQWLSTQESMIKDSYNTQQKAIEDAYKAQEISAAQYYARQLEADESSLREREAARAEAQTRFDAEVARRKQQIADASPDSKARATALSNLANEEQQFAEMQKAARQKDLNSMAAHSSDMVRELDKESKKVTSSVDTYIADMQRKAQADAQLQAAREAMVGQSPELIAGMEAELKVRADAAKILDQTAEAYALAAKNAREFEGKLQTKFDGGQDATKEEIALLETLQYAAKQARENLLKLGGAVDTTALDSSITATAASIKAQTDKLAGDITKTLADGIMSAGKDGGEGLRKALEDVLVTKPFRIVVEAMLQPISQSIAQGIMGQSVGGAAGANGLQTALNTASLAVSTFGTNALGAAKAVTLSGASISSALTTGAEMLSAGEFAAGAGQIAGALGPAAIAAVAAKALFDSMQGSVTPTGTYLYGGQGRFGGRQDFAQSGGLFGGGNTKNSSWFDPAPEVAKYMGAVEEAVVTSVKGWAQAIGLSTEAVDGFSKQIEVSIGGLNGPETKAAIDKAFGGLAEDMVQSIFGDKLLALSAPGEDASKTLVRLGTDLTTVNSILSAFGKPLFDISLAGVSAAEALLKTVGGLDKFTELAGTLESVNVVLAKLGQSTFDISMDGAKAANDLAKSVGGTAKLSGLADDLIHVNENLSKLGEPLLDVSVASAKTAHNMLTATDSAVKAMEAADKLESSYAIFAKNLSKDPDTTQVASLQAIFDRAMANVTKFIPSIKGQSDLTSVTYDQYAGYTDPQRTKLDAAASAFKDLQTAIDSAAKTAQSAAKTAQDAAETAAKAYEDALKSVEASTRDVNRQLRDFGKTDFQKKLSQIAYAGQDKQSELDKLSAKAAELSATANALSIKASNLSLDSVATISNDLISASIDLSDSSKEVSGNIKDTLTNSTAALGDALTLVPAISSLFDGILAGLLKIPPALQLVSNAVQGVGSAASNASGGLTAFGAAAGMAGSSATSATGPVNSVGAAFSAITPSASAAGAALSALGTAFGAASAALASLTATFGGAASALDGLNASFASAATGLGSLGSAFESAGASGASLVGSLGAVSGAMEGIAGAAAGAAGGIAAAVSALSAASSVQAPSVASATPAVVVAAASGGAIHGPGTSTSDSVPAMLSDGEYVIKASSVDKYGTGFLDALNAGTLKSTIYRADGGTVAANVTANTTSAYLDRWEELMDAFGGTTKTFSDAVKALGANYDPSMTATSAKTSVLDLLQTLKPSIGSDGLPKFTEAQMSTLSGLDALLPAINTVISTLEKRQDWQDKLNVLTGTTTERELALQKDLASTTDTTTQNLIRQVYAQEDLNKAREEEAKALDSVRDAMKNFQKESSSLEAELNSAFSTNSGDSAAKTIRKDLALADVRKSVEDAGLLQSSPAYAAMSAADKLKTNATIQGIRDTAALAEKQYDLNEARREEIKLLADAKSRLKSYTDAGASKEIEKMRLQGNDAGANAAQRGIDLADVFKSTADAMALLKTEGLTPLDIAALNLTISTNKATEAQYDRNIALDAEIEILGRYKSVQEDAAATEIELLKAQGETAKATAIELANATKGFNDAQIATYRQTQANKGLIASLGNLSSTADMVTNSRIGLLTAKGDKTGAAALQRELDIAPYVKSIADATKQLSIATTQTEKDALNLTIKTDRQSIANYDLSKSLDAQAQAATEAKSAADALAQSYEDLKKQIAQANVELLRAQGDTAAADEAAMALALRDHAGDAYYETLYRELLTIQKLTSARQQLNTLNDSIEQNEIKLIRARAQNVSASMIANAKERDKALAPVATAAVSAQQEIARSNLSFAEFMAAKGLTGTFGSAYTSTGAFDQSGSTSPYERSIKAAQFDKDFGVPGSLESRLLKEFASLGRTESQKAGLQGIVDAATETAKAYDLNRSREAELKIIELQDEAYKANLDAQQKVTDAQKAYADVLKSTISTMQDFLKTLDGAATPTQNLSQARTDFRAVADKAAAGDTSAYKDLTPAARAFLDLSKNYSKSIQDYRRDEAAVRTTLNAVIQKNQAELDKLPKEIAAAADPTKEAWLKLQEATAKEADTSFMLAALGVDKAASTRRLRTAEETLSDRYLEAVMQLEESKRTSFLKVIRDAVNSRVEAAPLPDYSATFNLGEIWGTKIASVLPDYSATLNLGEIWGTKIASVLPQARMTNLELNALIAQKFPGMVPSDFLSPLTPDNMTNLIRGVMPEQLTASDLVSSTADVSDLVSTKIGEILPADFAGEKFDAAAMMQDAINKAMATLQGTVTTGASTDIGTGTGTGTTTGTGATGGTVDVTAQANAASWYEGIFDRYGAGQSRTGTLQEYLQKAHSSGRGGWLWSSAAYAASIGKTTSDLIDAMHSAGLSGWGDMSVPELQAQLKSFGIPAFAQGTNYVPRNMLAEIHAGEAIIPAPFNPERYGRASGNDALVAEIKALRDEVARLREEQKAGNNAIAANTRKTAQTLTKFDVDGLPETRA